MSEGVRVTMRVLAAAAASAAVVSSAAAAQAPPPPPGVAPSPVAPAEVNGRGAKGCRMISVADLPISFERNRPIIPGAVNGQPIRILLDTGAGRSMLFRPTAQRLKLKEQPLISLARSSGAGGTTQLTIADLETFKLGDTEVKTFKVVVGGERAGDIDMLLGEEFLSQADLDLDLRNNHARMLRPVNCRDEDMPYWAKGAYSQAPLGSEFGKLLVVPVRVNGFPVRAILDTGASRSVITPDAARRVGIKLGEAAGRGAGIGAQTTQNRYGAMDAFVLGDETIRGRRILVSDLFSNDRESSTDSRLARQIQDLPEMLLGADFLAAHHVLISRSRKTVYFTYEGGTVFAGAPAAAAVTTPASP